MSNSSPVVLRIQQSALVFVVLLLALGALILAANNIDPNAAVRGDIRYTLWNSPDGLLSLEYPAGWTPLPQTAPLQYAFAPQDRSALGVFSFNSLTKGAIKITDADKNPQGVLDKIAAAQPSGGTYTSRPVVVDGIQAVAGLSQTTSTDANSGASRTESRELWVVPLDGSDVLLAQISTSSDGYAAVKPIWDHVMNSVRINNEAALQALVGTPAPTAAATLAATAGATEPATPQATANVTSAATAVATP